MIRATQKYRLDLSLSLQSVDQSSSSLQSVDRSSSLLQLVVVGRHHCCNWSLCCGCCVVVVVVVVGALLLHCRCLLSLFVVVVVVFTTLNCQGDIVASLLLLGCVAVSVVVVSSTRCNQSIQVLHACL